MNASADRARGKSLLTATRLGAMRRCPRQHYYRYELGLSRIRQADALRFGAAFHVGLEAYNSGPLFHSEEGIANILDEVTGQYDVCPDWADPVGWEVEKHTLRGLLTGHFWRYGSDDLEYVAAEQTFDMPLINPATSASSRTFRLAGKIDGIVRLADGRLAVLEYKTAGEDISPNGDYWQRLRCDGQISMYVLAARAIGYDVATVLYDVTRKPTIRLRRDESPEQYGQRLVADIGDRPDYYFQRREVPRLKDELAQFRAELWHQAKQLMAAQRHGRWFRNVGRQTCTYCQFAGLCLSAVRVTPDSLPAGYEILPDVHPELSSTGDSQ